MNEPKHLRMSEFYCRGCHSPASLDENQFCEFCRRMNKRIQANAMMDPLPVKFWILILAAVGVLIAGILVAMRYVK